ncbi:MAG: acyltransferase [Limnobacter sp.]|uniref:acyltransferase n=1 Tax=Limnobacter sp. TaxID=2003368 RepID=UPI0040384B30
MKEETLLFARYALRFFRRFFEPCRSLLNIVFNNKLSIKIVNLLLLRVSINCRGSGNLVDVHGFSCVGKVKIFINGDRNIIKINKNVDVTYDLEIIVLGNGSTLTIGSFTSIESAHLAIHEGTFLEIGDNCMIAKDVVVRTGDAHRILQIDSGELLNKNCSVVIGSNVWIGESVYILKGSVIPSGSVIGARSIVTASLDVSPNCIYVGSPVKCVASGVSWVR